MYVPDGTPPQREALYWLALRGNFKFELTMLAARRSAQSALWSALVNCQEWSAEVLR